MHALTHADTMKEVEEKSQEILSKWAEKSQEVINEFAGFFGRKSGGLMQRVRKVS